MSINMPVLSTKEAICQAWRQKQLQAIIKQTGSYAGVILVYDIYWYISFMPFIQYVLNEMQKQSDRCIMQPRFENQCVSVCFAGVRKESVNVMFSFFLFGILKC